MDIAAETFTAEGNRRTAAVPPDGLGPTRHEDLQVSIFSVAAHGHVAVRSVQEDILLAFARAETDVATGFIDLRCPGFSGTPGRRGRGERHGCSGPDDHTGVSGSVVEIETSAPRLVASQRDRVSVPVEQHALCSRRIFERE